MTGRLRFVTGILGAQLAWSPALTAVGLTGLALGAVCILAALARGAAIPPRGAESANPGSER